MALSRPLLVAAVAAGLLVVTLAVDATMDRSYHIDLQIENGSWRTIGSEGEIEPSYFPRGAGAIRVGQNDSVTLRFRVENGYPFGVDREFVVLSGGNEVHRARLDAPGSSSATSEFDLPVSRLLTQPARPEPDGADLHYPDIQVEYGRVTVHSSLALEVVR